MHQKEKAAQMQASKKYSNLSINNSTPIDRILYALKKVCKSSKPGSWMALCPAHEDKSPSLSIRELPDGRVLINCLAGCAPIDVLGSIFLRFEDLFPTRLTDTFKKSENKPFNALDILVALRSEFIRVLIIGRDMLEDKHTEDNQKRLLLAIERIDAGIAVAGGNNV